MLNVEGVQRLWEQATKGIVTEAFYESVKLICEDYLRLRRLYDEEKAERDRMLEKVDRLEDRLRKWEDNEELEDSPTDAVNSKHGNNTSWGTPQGF